MLNASYQQANDEASYEDGGQKSDFISMNASYSYSIVPSNATLALSVNVYTNNAAGIKSNYWGPTLSATKGFLDKKLRASLASSYNETSANNVKSSPILNNRLGLTYSPKSSGEESKSQHNFALNINALNKLKNTEQQSAFTEITLTFNYSYSF